MSLNRFFPTSNPAVGLKLIESFSVPQNLVANVVRTETDDTSLSMPTFRAYSKPVLTSIRDGRRERYFHFLSGSGSCDRYTKLLMIESGFDAPVVRVSTSTKLASPSQLFPEELPIWKSGWRLE